MYWDNGTGKAGHETVGAPEPKKTVLLAEGCTAGFDTFFCIQNPDLKQDANVKVTYMTSHGPVTGQKRVVRPGGRITVNAAFEIPNTDSSIKLSSDIPIMAERSMYWNNKGGGHVSIGSMK